MKLRLKSLRHAAPTFQRGAFVCGLALIWAGTACKSTRIQNKLSDATRPLSPYAESELARITHTKIDFLSIKNKL